MIIKILVPSHPQHRHTQTSGIALLTSNKYQPRGQSQRDRAAFTHSQRHGNRARTFRYRARLTVCFFAVSVSRPLARQSPSSVSRHSYAHTLRSEILRYATQWAEQWTRHTATLLTSVFTTVREYSWPFTLFPRHWLSSEYLWKYTSIQTLLISQTCADRGCQIISI